MRYRRRVFALPFVAIIGCGGGATSTPTTPTTPEEPPASTAQSLAEPPGGTPTKGVGPAGQVMLTYPSGDVVYVAEDGTCHAQYKEHCGDGNAEVPTVTHCNPPPPQQVRCPAEAK
ncbi:MAG: hypothetical protein AB7T06_37190 [Kofleriaceae bacterium]